MTVASGDSGAEGAVSAEPAGLTLDDPQPFERATSYEVREVVEKLVKADLLGPWGGEVEQFAPRALGPRERYLVGMLGPKPAGPDGSVVDASVPESEGVAAADGQDAELPEIQTPQTLGRIWASSMGLAFAVNVDVDAVQVVARWGEYSKQEIEVEGKERKQLTWVREPREFTLPVRLDGQRSQRLPLVGSDPSQPGVQLAVQVRPRDGQRVVEITLINALDEPKSNADTAWLFQAELTVTAEDGQAAVFRPIDDPVDTPVTDVSDTEEAHLTLLYRDERRYASGRNVAVHAEVPEGERRAVKLQTTWMPVYDVPATIAPAGADSRLANLMLSMDHLAKVPATELKSGLEPLVKGYREWLVDQALKVPTLPGSLVESAEAALTAARVAADRIEAGVRLLTDPFAERHEEALEAFRFANASMADQRRRTSLGRLRAEQGLGYEQALEKVLAEKEKGASWRPFQLAFVLLNLPSLTHPDHAERSPDRSGVVDLLFFPTGGGKTEAYLGLTAFTFAIRRLQGVVGSGADARDGGSGVAVLMRYTLRLLTAQQFQRAAALVCATELIRQSDPGKWGSEPFRIGLWVGGKVSPNWYPEAERQIQEARDTGNSKGINVLQTLSCPWCGTPLLGHRDLFPNGATRRVHLFCANAEGDKPCPFSRRASDEGLPILTVDEEIYRYAPSLVIATVDKLAQLSWKGYTGILFGRVSRRCPRHGYRHDDLDTKTGCTAQKHPAKDGLPAATTTAVGALRPPDLIIQDELHLISGALGTTVGLFETAVNELSSWRPNGADGKLTGAKVVASTATTRRAASQVLGVFGRGLAIFPPQVIDVSDTFFSEQVKVTPKNPGRRYMGICAHGVRFKAAQIRVAEILLLAGQTAFDRYGDAADPYMTLVGYFSATRELAGMRRYLDDDVVNRVRTHGAAKGLSNRVLRRVDLLGVQELTSRISSGDISEVLKKLEFPFDASLDTSVRKRLVREDFRDVLAERKKSRNRSDAVPFHEVAERWSERQQSGASPVDVVLATSMLQVGVDVSRFGLMVMTGQPKNTAEYIQASSRVGRDSERPGLVVTLYNWARPRDLAHYEDFEHYHATFYRQVEALSVTPLTRRSLDRSTAAMAVAAIRNVRESNSHNIDAQSVELRGSLITQMIKRMLDRADAIAGPRGAEYMKDRLDVFLDSWHARTNGDTHLGYEAQKTKNQQTVPLLERAGSGRWGTFTVGMSMRETESEINLLVPGSGTVYDGPVNVPPWTFESVSATDEDVPDGDELGVTQLPTSSTGKGK